MNEELTDMEKAVLDFIKDNSGFYEGRQVADSMRQRIDHAVISLVDRGILQVALDWTLKLREAKR